MSSQVEEMLPNEKLGDFIARVREAHNMTVEDLSVATKIAVNYIKSIEASDWKAFPVAAYVRGYLQSICNKLNLDKTQVLKAYAKELGVLPDNDFVDVSIGKKITPLKDDENKKKSMVVPIVIIVLIVAFVLAAHFLDLQSFSEKTPVNSQALEEPVIENDSIVESEIPDGAELLDSSAIKSTDSVATDSAKTNSSIDSVALKIEKAIKESDLPASATIFISSDSKKADVKNSPKTLKTNFMLIGSGNATSWVGLRRGESRANGFAKEANISKAGVKMVYTTSDTLCVTIGDPVAISKMLLNNVETKLPEMKSGRVTNFCVLGGVIVK